MWFYIYIIIGYTTGWTGEQVCLLVKEYDGLDKIEALQQHENKDIYQLSLNIIDKYFSDEVTVINIQCCSMKIERNFGINVSF